MPAKTAKMQRFMGGCAHNPSKMSNCPNMSKEKMREFSHKPSGGYSSKSTAGKIVKKLKGS